MITHKKIVTNNRNRYWWKQYKKTQEYGKNKPLRNFHTFSLFGIPAQFVYNHPFTD